MKKIAALAMALSLSLLSMSASAFCVYNSTTGSQTSFFTDKNNPYPTLIMFGNKIVSQGESRCDISGPRNEDSQTNLTIWKINTFMVGRNEIGVLGKQAICQMNVYNKGGYVVVNGSGNNLSCATYRD